MSGTLVLFLPTEGVSCRWLRIADGHIAARGEGFPDIDALQIQCTIAVAPAEAVTLHWAELPDRSTAQAVTAARLLVTDVSAAPVIELHVAVGREDGNAGRPIGVVTATQMRAWLATLASNGIDPTVLVPAPMLLARPESDYCRADLGGEGVVRGPTSGFADEAQLTDLITRGAALTTLDRDEVDASIVAFVAAPTLNLRQGDFARRNRVPLEWSRARRPIWLGVAILSVTLLHSLVDIAKLNLDAASIDARADALARTALPRGETVDDAGRQLGERLVRLRGPGLGFSGTAASVYAAVGVAPGAELRALSFDASGKMRATIAVENEGMILDIMQRLQRRGFTVSPSIAQNSGGIISVDLTVGGS